MTDNVLFPQVTKISVHISTMYHVAEQKLCRTFNNCSLCDRLNLRKKNRFVCRALSCSLCICNQS